MSVNNYLSCKFIPETIVAIKIYENGGMPSCYVWGNKDLWDHTYKYFSGLVKDRGKGVWFLLIKDSSLEHQIIPGELDWE